MKLNERAFVWLGGGVFVASLLYAVFTYAFRWSQPRATNGDAWNAWLANLILFGLFASHHSLFARDAVKNIVRRVVPDRLVRSVFVWTASLLFILVLTLWRPVPGELYHLVGWPRLLLAALQLAGLWFVSEAVRAIDPLVLAGIKPGENDITSDLQIRGAYRIVRHPLYLGWLALVFGSPHMTGDRFSFAAISSAYLLIAIPWEERSLEAVFGEAYARYRARVRWRVIPYVY
jgi:protein-S-isoprenylcysteine O-methyltransferase Ste14